MDTRIVITGLGVVSPAGTGQAAFWQGLMDGSSNIADAPWVQPSGMRCTKVCQIPKESTARNNGKLPNSVRFIVRASEEALADSGLRGFDKDLRIGVALGTAVGGVEASFDRGSLALDGRTLPANMLAEHFGLLGPVSTVPVACAAGAMALIHAVLQIQNNRADVMLAGGFDEVSEVPFAGFLSLHLLTNDCIRPFDRQRSGFLIGEGAGILVLEKFESAKKRGAQIYGEIRGFGISSDAFHVIHPHPQAAGLIKAMEDALRMARCAPEEIDYVNSHGTATKLNDKSECLALKSVFSRGKKRILTSSLKAILGHTMGAAGAIETAGCLLALKHQCIAPTWNFQESDPECDVDCVPNEPRPIPLKSIMKNSSGFGGTNCSVVIASA